MTAWLSLTKKELRLGVPVFLIPVIAYIVIAGIAAFFGNRAGHLWEVLAAVSLAATGAQVFYLAFYMLYSLQAEKKKLHLWLHTPMPAYSLLLAKMSAGLISMIITLFITGTVALVAINQSPELADSVPWSTINDYAFTGGLHFFMFAFDIAIWFVFYWMIYLLLSRFFSPFLSFIFTFIIFLVTSSFYGWFTESWLYQKITMWGAINTELTEGPLFNSEFIQGGASFSAEMGKASAYLGEYVFGIVIALILFWAASWILDRKVEV